MQIFELLLFDGSPALGLPFCSSEKRKGLASALSQLGVHLCIQKRAVFENEPPTCSMRTARERRLSPSTPTPVVFHNLLQVWFFPLSYYCSLLLVEPHTKCHTFVIRLYQ